MCLLKSMVPSTQRYPWVIQYRKFICDIRFNIFVVRALFTTEIMLHWAGILIWWKMFSVAWTGSTRPSQKWAYTIIIILHLSIRWCLSQGITENQLDSWCDLPCVKEKHVMSTVPAKWVDSFPLKVSLTLARGTS